jgi:hypothetical protein
MKGENQSLATATEIRQRPVAVAGFQRAGLVGFQPDSATVIGCREIRVSAEFR